MEEKARAIYEIIKDYRNDDGIFLQVSDIIEWACQFGDEAEFMLEELHHLLGQVYVSKAKAERVLRDILNQQYKDYGFSSLEEYLQKTCFLRMQSEQKSQGILISMIDDLVFEKTGNHLSHYDNYEKTLYVYLDDVLATGGTIRKDLFAWLSADDHAKKVRDNSIRLELSLICAHTWGLMFLTYGLSRKFGNLPIKVRMFYEIQNHLKMNNQDLNIAIPVKNQPQEVKMYLEGLSATKYAEYAFRDASRPVREVFFTSPSNRVRFENNLLAKGLYIISLIKGEPKPNIRPLGLISPSYRTFGLGTHFFTWRNVPNNCPLVYWWQVPGHDWKPLFPSKRN